MYRIFVLATAATLTLAQEYPKPIVPSEYVVDVINYDYSTYKPSGYFSTEKKSSKLNKISLTTGKPDSKGKPYIDFARVTDGNAGTDL